MIAGRYAPDYEVARSASATVYAAQDRHDGRKVAVKVLLGPGEQRARFTREAVILSQLRHPGIVRYVDHGVTARGETYLVTEWLDGHTLEDELKRRALAPREAVDVTWQIATALELAHARGLLHRDVKPSNAMLVDGRTDRVKLIDFGVACDPSSDRRFTAAGELVGTPQYMAPEQARGETELDPRTDVFGLGCVLYECLSGSIAFDDRTLTAVLARVMSHEPAPIERLVSGLPPALVELVRAMLAKARHARPAHAGEVEARLRELLDLPAEAWGMASDSVPARPRRLRGPEQRLVTVVAVRDAAAVPDGTAETMPAVAPPPHQRELIGLAERFGGTISGLASDATMVVFAGDSAPTDQAGRAARLALALRAADPALPIALITGRGAVSAQSLSGHVIDRAMACLAVLEPACERPGDRERVAERAPIRLDDLSAGLLDAEFEVLAGEHSLVLWAERDGAAARTVCGRPTPHVGRRRELMMLEAALFESAEEGAARAVLVTGPPGSGKSRLRRELIASLRSASAPPELVFGRGEVASAGAPFGVLAHAVRRLAGVLAGEPVAVQRRRLRVRVGRYLRAEDAERVAVFIGELAGVPAAADGYPPLAAARADRAVMVEAVHSAWEDWIAAESAHAPVLILLEDLHWGDAPSVQLLDRMLRNLEGCPITVVALARPSISDEFPELWARRGLLEIRLGKLSCRAQESLVRATLGDRIDAARRDRLIELADGNPYFLEELMRAVVAGSETLPETLLGMVQSRLDRLSDTCRQVLRAASVFGDVFWPEAVGALLGDKVRGVDDAIAELVERELLVARSGSSFPDQPEFAFRQDPVREAAYALLSERDRRDAHRAAGEWLEARALPAGEASDSARARAVGVPPTQLAEHFRVGQRTARAVFWLRCAAERALDGNDFAAAAAAATQGSELEAGGAFAGELALLAAEAAWWQGDYRHALTYAERAVSALPAGTASWFRAMEQIPESACRLSELDFVSAWVTLATVSAVEDAAEPAQLRCLCRGVLRLMFAGQAAAAAPALARIDALASGREFPPHVSAWRYLLAALRAYFSGDPAANAESLHKALEGFERAGDARNACQTRAYLGFGYVELGQFERAEALLRDALAQASRLGVLLVAANARENLAVALAARGELDEAWELELRATETFAAHGERRKEGGCRRYLARIALRRGELERAEAEARAACALLDETRPLLAGARAVLAQVLLARGDADAALLEARAAMALVDELGEVDEGESLVRLTLAEALEAAGDADGAARALARAQARLCERAARIADPVLRRSFLDAVPEHRRTAELAAARAVRVG
jgi:tetratricopeptide (TPR) repeat protein